MDNRLPPPPSLRGNYAYNALSLGVNILVPLVMFSYVARVLGPVYYGKTSFAQSIVSFFLVAAGFSIPLYGAREIARHRDSAIERSRIWTELMALNACGTLLTSVVFVVVVLTLPRLAGDKALFFTSGAMLFLNFFSGDWLYQGLENYRYNSLRAIFFRILITAAVFVVVKGPGDYIAFAFLGVIVVAGSNVVGFVRAPTVAPFTLRDIRPLRHLKPLLFLFGSAATVSVYIYLDSVLLGFLAGDRAVGLYTAAMKIDKTIVLGLSAAGSVLIPRISWHIQRGNATEYGRIAQKSVDFMFLLAFPAMIGIMVLAPHLVALLAGPRFTDAVPTTRIAALLLPLIGFNTFLGMQILIPNGEERKVFVSTAVAAVVDMGLIVLLVPRFSHNGAAIAAVAAESAVIIVQLSLARRSYLTFRILNQRTALYALAGLAMGAAVYGITLFIHSTPIAVITGMPVGAILYAGILLAAGEPLSREVLSTVVSRVSNR